MIRQIDGYEVLYVATNGQDLLEQIRQRNQAPDLALVDLHMPVMDGFETTSQLRQLFPTVRILIVTISDLKEDIVRAIREGAHGYWVKDSSPKQLRYAMEDLMTNEYSFPKTGAGSDQPKVETLSPTTRFNLTDSEWEFLRLASSELTYREIADRMDIPLFTLEGCRASVFAKMKVQTREDMVFKAVSHGLIDG